MLGDVKLIKEILLRPSKFFSRIPAKSLGEIYKFWIQLNLVSMVIRLAYGLLSLPLQLSSRNPLLNYLGDSSPLSAIAIGGTLVLTFVLPILVFLVSITFGFILLLISTAMIHVIAYILGCRGYMKTLTALTIGSTPSIILAPIPVLGWISWIYSLIIDIIGMSKLHKNSIGKSIVIILIPIIIGAIVVFLLVGLTYLQMSKMITEGTTKTVSILDASCVNGEMTMVISNDGNAEINALEDLSIHVGAEKRDVNFNPSEIPPQSTSVATVQGDPGENSLLVVSPTNSARQVVYC